MYIDRSYNLDVKIKLYVYIVQINEYKIQLVNMNTKVTWNLNK